MEEEKTAQEGQYGRNLAQGSVVKQLILFALPFLASNLVQSFYSVADMWIVGQFADNISMSGVNIGSQITFILTNVVVGLCTGGTILIAQAMGRKDQKVMEEVTATLMTTLLIAGAVITALMIFLRVPILNLIQTPPAAYQEADRYLTVTCAGILFIFAYNVLSAVQRGMGDSKRPFYFVLIACITNIVLDYILVAIFHLGALGAAIATVFSQALSVVLCMVTLVRSDFVFDFKPKSFRINRHYMGHIFRLGLPSAVQNGVTSLSFLIITILTNIIGQENASAAVGVVSKFNGFAIMPAVALGASISTVCAQNIGAGRWDRAVKTCWIGTGIAFAFSAAVFAVAKCFPAQIIGAFNEEPALVEYGVVYMSSFCFDYLFVPLCFCINGLFIASGHTTFSLLNNMMSALLLRIPVCVIFSLVLDMGMFGVGLGAPVASAGALCVIILYYLSGRWRRNIAMDGT